MFSIKFQFLTTNPLILNVTFFFTAAKEDAKIWVMDRKAFHTIMMKTGLQRQEDNIKFLRR